MIPKIIHYCWYGGKGKSRLHKKCIESWRKFMPNYEIKEWNERNTDLSIPFMKAAYQKKIWSKVANYSRLEALYSEGGVYLDTDVEVLKSFDPLLDQSCFFGFQDPHIGPSCVNSAVIGAVPGYPLLKEALTGMVDRWQKESDFGLSPFLITQLLISKGLREYKQQTIAGSTLYPVEFFYPFPWWSKFSLNCVGPNTYCIHWWDRSWGTPHQKFIFELKRIFKKRRLPTQPGVPG